MRGSLAALGSDAQVTILPGRDHANVLTSELCSDMRRGMTASLVRHHPDVAITKQTGDEAASRSRLP